MSRDIHVELVLHDVPDEYSLNEVVGDLESNPIITIMGVGMYPTIEHAEEEE